MTYLIIDGKVLDLKLHFVFLVHTEILIVTKEDRTKQELHTHHHAKFVVTYHLFYH